VYFLRGLPWDQWTGGKESHEKLGKQKQKTSVKELCEGLPGQYLYTSLMFLC
jgi:hypothetical protein